MSIAFDAVTTQASTTGNMSFTHTPVGTPRGITFQIVETANGGADNVSSVTYGGVAMTRVTGATVVQAAVLDNGAVYTYFLGASIPTGAQTVAATCGGGTAKIGAVCSVTAASDTSVDCAASLDSAGVTDPSVTLAATTSVFAMGALHTGTDAATAVSPQGGNTQLVEVDFGTAVGNIMRRTAIESDSILIKWNSGTGEKAAIGAVGIREGAGTSFDVDASLGVGLAKSESCSVGFAASESLGVAPAGSQSDTVSMLGNQSLVVGPTLIDAARIEIFETLNLTAGSGAGPGASLVQSGALILDQIVSTLVSAGIPVNVALTFAAGVQLIVVEPPNTFNAIFTLATTHGLTMAAKSIPEVSLAMAVSLGLIGSGGRAASGELTLAAQQGIAITAQQIARASMSLGAGFALLPVADGIFRSVLLGPVGLSIVEAAQFSPVGQVALVEGVTISADATDALAVAVALGVVLTIQQQTGAMADAMVALGANPQQAISASAAFQAMLALGVRNTIVSATAFGSPLAGSILQIIDEVYRIADIQEESGN